MEKKFFIRKPAFPFRRTLSALLLISFLLPQDARLLLPSAEASEPGSRVPVLAASSRIPESLGQIEETFQGESGQSVVLIQDAHGIPEAQRSIRDLILFFTEHSTVKLVGTEGASLRLDAELFKSYPDKEMLKKVFDGYLDRGELTGVSAAALFGDREAEYFGLEDWSLYEKGLGFYLAAQSQETELLQKTAAMREKLDERKTLIYSPKLLEADKALASFYSGKGSLSEALVSCAAVVKPEVESPLAMLLETVQKSSKEASAGEQALQKTARETRAALEAGTLPVSADAAALFQGNYQAFQTSQISAEDFAAFFQHWAETEGLRIQIPETLKRAARLQQKLSQLRGTALLKAFEAYEAKVKEALFENENQRKLDRQSKDLETLERIVRLELSRGEWESFQNRMPGSSSDLGKDALRLHALFYENAVRREGAFTGTLLEKMGERHVSEAVIVAGGFHAEGLMEKFRREGISYVRVTPAMSAVPETTSYRDHLRGKLSWEKYFKIENGKIDLAKAFMRAARDELLRARAPGSEGMLKRWRDQVIRRQAFSGHLARAGQYTAYLDETVQEKRGAALTAVDKFLQGLGDLEARKGMNQTNILNLLKTATIASLESADFAVQVRLTPPDLLAASARSSGRSELRAGEEEAWETFDGLDVESRLSKMLRQFEWERQIEPGPEPFQAVRIDPSARTLISGKFSKRELERMRLRFKTIGRSVSAENLWGESLEAVFREVLTNAKQGSSSQKNDIPVELDVALQSGELVFRIRDKGVGIDRGILREKLDGWEEENTLTTKSLRPGANGNGFAAMYHHAKLMGGRVEVETQIPALTGAGYERYRVRLEPGAKLEQEEASDGASGTTVTLRIPVQRSELRSSSVHESMMGPLIYPRTLLLAPENSTYSQENLFEAPVIRAAAGEKALKMFQRGLETYLQIGKQYPRIGQLAARLSKDTTVLAVDLPSVFYSPGEKIGITHILQISMRRRAVLISKKFLESLDPDKPFDVKLVAFYLHIGQTLLEKYDDLEDYFRYENQNHGVVSRRLQTVYRGIEQALDDDQAWDQEAFLGNVNFNPSNAKLTHLRQLDEELRKKERERLQLNEEQLLKNSAAIRRILEPWDPQDGFDDEEIPQVSERIARVVPGSIKSGESMQQNALHVLKRTIQSFQKRAFYYESEGDVSKARDYYAEVEELYKASQKIDFGGFFPLRVQEELVYFHLRSGNLEKFEKEFTRLINVHYVPYIRRPYQQAVHDNAYPLWLMMSTPDLLYKLQYYRVGADAKRNAMIERIEKTLTRAYFRELKNQKDVEKKFALNLTNQNSDELKNPLLVPVLESGDVFSFSWEKMTISDHHLEVRLEVSQWVDGPDRPETVGHFDFALIRDGQGRWSARTSRNQWPTLLKNDAQSPLVLSASAVRDFRNIPAILVQLALRLARESGAETLVFSVPVELQREYQLPYRDRKQGFRRTLRFKDLKTSELVTAPLKGIRIRRPFDLPSDESVRSELRSEEPNPDPLIRIFRDARVEAGPGGTVQMTWIFRVQSRAEFRDIFQAIAEQTGVEERSFKQNGYVAVVERREDGSYVFAREGRVDILEPDSAMWNVPAGTLLKAAVTLSEKPDESEESALRKKVREVLEEESELLVMRLRPEMDQEKVREIAKELVDDTDFPGWRQSPQDYFRGEAAVNLVRDGLFLYLSGIAAVSLGLLFLSVSLAFHGTHGGLFFLAGMALGMFAASAFYVPWFILAAFRTSQGIRLYLNGDIPKRIAERDPEVMGYLTHEWLHALKHSWVVVDARGTSAVELLRRYELEKKRRKDLTADTFSESLRRSTGKRVHSLFAFLWRGPIFEMKKKEFLKGYRAVQKWVSADEETRTQVLRKLDSDRLFDYRGLRLLHAFLLRIAPGVLENYAQSFRLGGIAAALSDLYGVGTGWRFLKYAADGDDAAVAFKKAIPRSELRTEMSVKEDFDQSSRSFLDDLVKEIGQADVVITIPVFNEIAGVAETFGVSLPGTHGQTIDADQLLRDMQASVAESLKKFEGRRALILAVGETKGPVAQAVLEKLRATAASLETSSAVVRVYGKEERFAGLLGKKWALRLGMRAAEALGGSFVSIDGDMQIEADYVEKITEPLRTGRADYVSPVYLRYWGRDDSSLIALFGFPFFSAVMGKKLRMPNEGGFAAGKNLVPVLLQEDLLWDNETLYESVFAATALFAGMKAEDVWLGEKLHKTNPIFETTFDAYVKYALQAMFGFLDARRDGWQAQAGQTAIDGLSDLIIPEGFRKRPLDDIFLKGVDPVKLKEHFGAEEASVRVLLSEYLPDLLPLYEKQISLAAENFGISSREWARVVFSVFKLYLETPDASVRTQIPKLLKPFFAARTAGFLQELSGLSDYGQAEELLNRQAREFAEEKAKVFKPLSGAAQEDAAGRSELRTEESGLTREEGTALLETTAQRVAVFLEEKARDPNLPGLAADVELSVEFAGVRSLSDAVRGAALEIQDRKVRGYLEQLAAIAEEVQKNLKGDAVIAFPMDASEKEPLETALAKILRKDGELKTHIVVPKALAQILLPERTQRHVVPSVDGLAPGQLKFALNADAIAAISGTGNQELFLRNKRLYALRSSGASAAGLDPYHAGIVDKATRILVALILAGRLTQAEQLKDKTARGELLSSVNLAFFGSASEIDEWTREQLIRFDEDGLTVDVGLIFKRLTEQSLAAGRLSRSA